jgi:hypothetical protein
VEKLNGGIDARPFPDKAAQRAHLRVEWAPADPEPGMATDPDPDPAKEPADHHGMPRLQASRKASRPCPIILLSMIRPCPSKAQHPPRVSRHERYILMLLAAQ